MLGSGRNLLASIAFGGLVLSGCVSKEEALTSQCRKHDDACLATASRIANDKGVSPALRAKAFLAKAIVLGDRHNYPAALEAINASVKVDPTDRAMSMKAFVHTRLGEDEIAYKILLNIALSRPLKQAETLLASEAAYRISQPQAAIDLATTVLATQPIRSKDKAIALSIRARSRIDLSTSVSFEGSPKDRRDLLELAVQDASDSVQLESNDWHLTATLVDARLNRDGIKAVREDLLGLHRKRGLRSTDLVWLAELDQAAGQTKAAQTLLNAALAKQPDNRAGLIARAWLFIEKGELGAAERDLDKAITKWKPSPQSLALLSIVSRGKGDGQRAASLLSEADQLVAQTLGDASALCLAKALAGTDIGQVCDHALEIQPSNTRALTGAGFARLNGKQLRGAIQAFNHAVERDKTSSLALLGRGWAQSMSGNCPAAQRDLDTAISRAPELSKFPSPAGHGKCGESRV